MAVKNILNKIAKVSDKNEVQAQVSKARHGKIQTTQGVVSVIISGKKLKMKKM